MRLWVDNILFDLPYVEERYQKTLEVGPLRLFARFSVQLTSEPGFFPFLRPHIFRFAR